MCFSIQWSGWWESNPRSQLGRLKFYHWTTPAIDGASGRSRTGTEFEVRGILSPVRLPISPPRQFGGSCRTWTDDRRVAVFCLTNLAKEPSFMFWELPLWAVPLTAQSVYNNIQHIATKNLKSWHLTTSSIKKCMNKTMFFELKFFQIL